MHRKHHIVITRQISSEDQQLAERLKLTIHVKPAIETRPRLDWSDVETILINPDYPIFAFTSRNAVRALNSYPKGGQTLLNGKRVYAVGSKTAAELRKLGCDPLLPDQCDGSGLAKKITEELLGCSHSRIPGVLHLCGNMRRNEFRDYLEGSGIDVRDLVVYRTILLPMNFDTIPKDALLFYSPSAIESFRKSGGFTHPSHQHSELFAIGHTTAEELSIETGRHVHVSPQTDSKELLRFTAEILISQKNE